MKILFPALLTIAAFGLAGFAQTRTLSPFERRANDIVAVINDPKDLEKIFSTDFLAQVPPAQVSEISKQITTGYGKALRIEKIEKTGEHTGKITVAFEREFFAYMDLSIENKEPFLVNGLRVTSIDKGSNSLEDIIGELKKLPGQTALTVARLGAGDFQSIAAHNADKPLAIGSTFKLYILSELVRSIAAGERKWSDTIELTEKSLPSGVMQNWETGAPVTFHTLASMMISISDNTATDQLITALGREKIEKMLSTAGNSNPALSVPFLKTAEMFKIKGSGKRNLASIYAAEDASGKRALLANEIAVFKTGDIDLKDFLKKPTYISQIEWFASTNDLARAMNWLRLNSEKSPTERARGILTINKALPPDEAANWNYVGYKGGSETGVISLTYLLQSKKSEWFVLSATWNDENAPVKDDEFVFLVQKAVKILREKTAQ